LIGTATATAVQGVARFTNLGILGLTSQTYTITYSASYVSNSATVNIAGTGTQTVNLTHGVASKLQLVRNAAGARSAIAFDTQPQVEVVDVKGNRVTTGTGASASVTVSFNGSGATLSGTVTRAASSGLVTYSGLALSGLAQASGGESPYNLVFASSGLIAVTQADLPLSAGNPARLTLVRRSEGTASGLAFTTAPQIGVLDGQGNTVVAATGTITATLTRVNSTGSFVNGSTTTTATAPLSDGVATFTDLGLTGVQNTSYAITYSATINSTVMVTARQDVTVTVGPPASLRVDRAAAGATSRVALTTQPRLSVLDSGGNLVIDPDMQGTVTLTATKSTDANVSAVVSNGSVPSDGGIAQFASLTLQGEATTYNLVYAFSNGTQSFSTSGSVALAAGPASQLVIERPTASTVAAGVAFVSSNQPIIRVTDADENLVSTSSAPITVTLSGNDNGGVLGGTATVNAVAGRAVFTGLNIRGTVGEYSLSYSTTQLGIASVTQPGTIAVTHGAVNKVVVVNASEVSAGSARSGLAFEVSPRVQVQDAWGNKVDTGVWASATITATSTTGSSRVGTSTAAATAGEITFGSLGLRGVAGTTYAVSYRATSGSSVLSITASHNATVSAGNASKIVLSRPSAGNSSGVAFSTQHKCVYLMPRTMPFATEGVRIHATLSTTPNGSLMGELVNDVTPAAVEAVTNEDGVATFENLGILGKSATSFTLNYRDADANFGAVTQTISLVPGAPSALQMVTSSNTSLASGSTFATAPSVRVVDAYGNSVATNSVVIAAELATGDGLRSGTVIGTTTRTTSNGVATFTGLGLRGVITDDDKQIQVEVYCA
jgi:hypothetical protein